MHAGPLTKLKSTARANLAFPIAKNLYVLNNGYAIQVQWDSLVGGSPSIVVAGKNLSSTLSCNPEDKPL